MKSIYLNKIEDCGLMEYINEVNMPDRNKEIVRKYTTGNTTYKVITQQYDISGERVRQLIEKYARKAYHIKKKMKLCKYNLKRGYK